MLKDWLHLAYNPVRYPVLSFEFLTLAPSSSPIRPMMSIFAPLGPLYARVHVSRHPCFPCHLLHTCLPASLSPIGPSVASRRQPVARNESLPAVAKRNTSKQAWREPDVPRRLGVRTRRAQAVSTNSIEAHADKFQLANLS